MDTVSVVIEEIKSRLIESDMSARDLKIALEIVNEYINAKQA